MNKIKVFAKIVLVLASILLFGGCSASPTTSSVPQASKIGVTEAYAMIQQNETNSDFVILDVRTPAEFAAGHIENAILVDYEAPSFRSEVNKLDKSKTYLVYCRTARRSGEAVVIMQELGFQRLYDMSGGIVEWNNAGYPVIK